MSTFHAAVAKAFQEPKFVEYLQNESLEPAVSAPETFRAFLKQDRESGARIVRRFNIPRS
ncbi:hypothetical protein D3C83_237980 [compost metagenome]